MNEEWIDIKGWNGKYQISNHGRLKSINGKFKKMFPGGFITVGTIGDTGYYSLTLRRPGKVWRIRNHTLVAEHFLHKPKIDGRITVNHKDGNKLNNHVSNLEWLSAGDNVKHAVRTGLLNIKGERHPNAKLTSDKVIEIRRLRKELNYTHQRLADMFGINRRQAGDVINGVNWGWLK